MCRSEDGSKTPKLRLRLPENAYCIVATLFNSKFRARRCKPVLHSEGVHALTTANRTSPGPVRVLKVLKSG